ncbi:hypothetical protein V6N13_041061 [Hibiscus sabdariffa]
MSLAPSICKDWILRSPLYYQIPDPSQDQGAKQSRPKLDSFSVGAPIKSTYFSTYDFQILTPIDYRIG